MLLPTDYLNMLASVVDQQPEPPNGSLAVRTQLARLNHKQVNAAWRDAYGEVTVVPSNVVGRNARPRGAAGAEPETLMIFGRAPSDGGVPVRTVLAQTRTKKQRDQLRAKGIETSFVPTATVKKWDSYPLLSDDDAAGGGLTIWDLRGTMFAADVGRLLAVVVDGQSLLSVVGGGERRLGVEVVAHWQRVYDYFGLRYPLELNFKVRWPRDADRVRQWREFDVRASLDDGTVTPVLVRDVVTHLTVHEADGDPPIAPLLAWLGAQPRRLRSLVLESSTRRVQSPAFAALVATTWPALRTATLTADNMATNPTLVLARWPNLEQLVLATTEEVGYDGIATVDLGGLAKLRKLTLDGRQLAPRLSLPRLTHLDVMQVTHVETAQLPQLRRVRLRQWPLHYGSWPLLQSLELGPHAFVNKLSLDALLGAAHGWPLLHTLSLGAVANDVHVQRGNFARQLAKVSAWPLLTHLRFAVQDSPWLPPEVDADWVTPLARAEFWPLLDTLEVHNGRVRHGQSLAPLLFDPHRTALTHLSLSHDTTVHAESLHSLVTPPADVLAMPLRTRQLPQPVARLRSLELDYYDDETLAELAHRLAHLPTSLETLTLLGTDVVAAQWRQLARQLYPRLRVVLR